MTVISTLVSQHCTVHATDSFITELQPDGCLKIVEAKQTKTEPVTAFRGAMSYFGLAEIGNGRTTLEWLKQQTTKANEFTEPEDFARFVCDNLNNELTHMTFEKPVDAGIGIHFTAYEYIDGYWIPELFVLSNFFDPQYRALQGEGVILNRQTYNVAFGPMESEPEHREPEYRLAVHHHLLEGGMLIYNNGDPAIFNPVAAAIFEMMKEIKMRGELVDSDDVSTYRKMARMPIEFISRIQKEFVFEGKRKVGGRLHDLSITPNGEYDSDTGDTP